MIQLFTAERYRFRAETNSIRLRKVFYTRSGMKCKAVQTLYDQRCTEIRLSCVRKHLFDMVLMPLQKIAATVTTIQRVNESNYLTSRLILRFRVNHNACYDWSNRLHC